MEGRITQARECMATSGTPRSSEQASLVRRVDLLVLPRDMTQIALDCVRARYESWVNHVLFLEGKMKHTPFRNLHLDALEHLDGAKQIVERYRRVIGELERVIYS